MFLRESKTWLVCLVSLTFAISFASAQRNPPPPYNKDDFVSCPSVLGLFPFTDKRSEESKYDEILNTTFYQTRLDLTKMSVEYTAAMLLAMDHVNEQDASVISELETCSYRFENPPFIRDSRREKNAAFDTLSAVKDEKAEICAIVGPFLEESIESTLQLAYTFQVPQFLFSMTDYRMALAAQAPNVIGNSYNDQVLAQDIVSFIEYLRRDYIAVVHFPNEVKARLTYQIIQHASTAHMTARNFELGPAPPPFDKSIQYPKTFREIKATGFRTLVMLYHRAAHLVEMAEAMEIAGLLEGDFVIVLLEQAAPPEAIDLVFGDAPREHPVWKLLRGSFVIRGLDGFLWKEDDPFVRSWRSLDSEFASRVQSMLPYNLTVPEDYFQKNDPYVRSSFVYDSVISMALSACQIDVDNVPAETRYLPTINAIRNMRFQGASGNVTIHYHAKLRERQHIDAGVYNLQVDSNGELQANLLAVRLGNDGNQNWQSKGIAIFADGRAEQPQPHLVVLKENYLSSSVRTLGFALFTICLVASVTCCIAIYAKREHPLIKSGQPFFLQLVLIGSCVTSASILTLSFDESSGWSNRSLSTACTLTPWLFFLGLITSYAGLFCKMWRVDRVLSMNRQTIKPLHVIGPLVALLTIAVALLTSWTAHDPWAWKRDLVRLDPEPETFGECRSGHFLVYFALLVAVTVIASGLATIWAFKTIDVPEALSETRPVLSAVLTHLQAWFIGLPVQVALQVDKSANATYLGRVSVIFIFSLSTVILVVGTKLYRVWFHGSHRPVDRVRISGLESGLALEKVSQHASAKSLVTAATKTVQNPGTFHDSLGTISNL